MLNAVALFCLVFGILGIILAPEAGLAFTSWLVTIGSLLVLFRRNVRQIYIRHFAKR